MSAKEEFEELRSIMLKQSHTNKELYNMILKICELLDTLTKNESYNNETIACLTERIKVLESKTDGESWKYG